MITNICPRCKSDNLNIRKDGFYGCKECGRTGKSYEVWIRSDTDGEVHDIRNVMREMAGILAEYTAPNLAAGLARVLEHYKTSASPTIAREIISRAVSEAFHTMYQMAVPFLPPEIQEDVQRMSDLVEKERLAEQKKESEENERRAAEAGDPGGAGGAPGAGSAEPVHGVVQAGADGYVSDPQGPEGSHRPDEAGQG